jgi:hypothetical protein
MATLEIPAAAAAAAADWLAAWQGHTIREEGKQWKKAREKERRRGIKV